MTREGPGTPLEALSRASVLVQQLRAALPGKAGRLLTCVDEVRGAWAVCDLTQFPFNLLLEELDAIESVVKAEYEDLDQQVDRRSSVFDQLVGFDLRLRFSLEFITVNRVFEGVEKRFQRIDDDVLPVQNYALRSLVSRLDERYIAPAVRQRFDAAIGHFDRGEYRASLQSCCEAGEALFGKFRTYLVGCGLSERPGAVGPGLEEIRAWLGKAESKDAQGDPFRSRSRLEWLLLSLFETLHYLRNAVMHPPEADQRPPRWQSERRATSREEPEWARLGLCVSLQIALELQAVLGHGAER